MFSTFWHLSSDIVSNWHNTAILDKDNFVLVLFFYFSHFPLDLVCINCFPQKSWERAGPTEGGDHWGGDAGGEEEEDEGDQEDDEGGGEAEAEGQRGRISILSPAKAFSAREKGNSKSQTLSPGTEEVADKTIGALPSLPHLGDLPYKEQQRRRAPRATRSSSTWSTCSSSRRPTTPCLA